MQLVVLRTARVAYSLRFGDIGKGRLGARLKQAEDERTGIKREGRSQKHCGWKGSVMAR